MQRSKRNALIFLLGAFLVGSVLGFTVDRMLTQGRHARREPSRDRMARDLDLNAQQRAQFDTILNRRRDQMRALWAPLRPQMDSIQNLGKALGDTTHEQLKRVLTADQAKKLDEMRERGRRRAAARARGDSNRDKHTPIP